MARLRGTIPELALALTGRYVRPDGRANRGSASAPVDTGGGGGGPTEPPGLLQVNTTSGGPDEGKLQVELDPGLDQGKLNVTL